MNEGFKPSAPDPSENKSEQRNTKEQTEKTGKNGGGVTPSREELKIKLDTLYTTLDTAREESKEKTTPKARETEQVIRDIDIRFNEFVDTYRVKNKIIPEFNEREAASFNEKLDKFIVQLSAPAVPVEKMGKPTSKPDEKPNSVAAKPIEAKTKPAEKKDVQKNAQEEFVKELYDQTVTLLQDKISLMQNQQKMAKEDIKANSYSLNSAFTLGGLVGTSVVESNQNALNLATSALEGATDAKGNTKPGLLQEKSLFAALKDLPADQKLPKVLSLRARLGAIDVPFDLNKKYGRSNADFDKRARAAQETKDADLTVDYGKINEALAASEAVFDAWETGIEIGSAVALGVATGGAGPAVRIGAELTRSIATEIQKVSAKQKTFEQGAQDAVISALSNALGAGIAKNIGKALKSGAKVAKFDTLIAKAAKLIEQTVKDPKKLAAVQKIGNAGANVVKNAGGNALEGATDGLVGGAANSIVDDVKEKGASALTETETYKKAGSQAYDNAKAGAAGGAVLGTATGYVVKGAEKGADILKNAAKNGRGKSPVDTTTNGKNTPTIPARGTPIERKNTNPKIEKNETSDGTKVQTTKKESPTTTEPTASQNPLFKKTENPDGEADTQKPGPPEEKNKNTNPKPPESKKPNPKEGTDKRRNAQQIEYEAKQTKHAAEHEQAKKEFAESVDIKKGADHVQKTLAQDAKLLDAVQALTKDGKNPLATPLSELGPILEQTMGKESFAPYKNAFEKAGPKTLDTLTPVEFYETAGVQTKLARGEIAVYGDQHVGLAGKEEGDTFERDTFERNEAFKNKLRELKEAGNGVKAIVDQGDYFDQTGVNAKVFVNEKGETVQSATSVVNGETVKNKEVLIDYKKVAELAAKQRREIADIAGIDPKNYLVVTGNHDLRDTVPIIKEGKPVVRKKDMKNFEPKEAATVTTNPELQSILENCATTKPTPDQVAQILADAGDRATDPAFLRRLVELQPSAKDIEIWRKAHEDLGLTVATTAPDQEAVVQLPGENFETVLKHFPVNSGDVFKTAVNKQDEKKLEFKKRPGTVGRQIGSDIHTPLLIEGENWESGRRFQTISTPALGGGTYAEEGESNNGFILLGPDQNVRYEKFEPISKDNPYSGSDILDNQKLITRKGAPNPLKRVENSETQ